MRESLKTAYVNDKSEFPGFERPKTASKPIKTEVPDDDWDQIAKKGRNRKKKGNPLEIKLAAWNKLDLDSSKANYAENIFGKK